MNWSTSSRHQGRPPLTSRWRWYHYRRRLRERAAAGKPPPRKKRRRSEARWIGFDESIVVGGQELKGGFYCGPTLYSPSGHTENCLVNPRLLTEPSAEGPSHPHSARGSFARLPPAERRAYLAWLASDRAEPVNPEFPLLYFFGLERRIFLDNRHDRRAIEEIYRLLAACPGNAALAAAGSAVFRALRIARNRRPKDFDQTLIGAPLTFEARMQIGHDLATGRALSAPVCLMWYVSRHRSLWPAALAERERIKARFCTAFRAVRRHGLTVPNTGRPLPPYPYLSASGTFMVMLPNRYCRWPDIAEMTPPPLLSAMFRFAAGRERTFVEPNPEAAAAVRRIRRDSRAPQTAPSPIPAPIALINLL